MDNVATRVDTEKLISEVQLEIKEKGFKNENVKFSDIPIPVSESEQKRQKQFKQDMGSLGACHRVVSYRPLKSNRAIGFLVVTLKKTIRKLTKFYVEPIVADQNEFNRLATTCIHEMYRDFEEMQMKIKLLEDEIKRIDKKDAV